MDMDIGSVSNCARWTAGLYTLEPSIPIRVRIRTQRKRLDELRNMTKIPTCFLSPKPLPVRQPFLFPNHLPQVVFHCIFSFHDLRIPKHQANSAENTELVISLKNISSGVESVGAVPCRRDSRATAILRYAVLRNNRVDSFLSPPLPSPHPPRKSNYF